MAEQRVDQAPDKQGVFKVVHFFQQVRSFPVMAIGGVAAAGTVPDVPLVKGKPQFLWRAFMSTHEVANGNRLLDLAFHA